MIELVGSADVGKGRFGCFRSFLILIIRTVRAHWAVEVASSAGDFSTLESVVWYCTCAATDLTAGLATCAGSVPTLVPLLARKEYTRS